MSFEPGYMQQLTHLSGFNAAGSNWRPEDAWGMVSLLYGRYPTTHLRVVWLLQVETFDNRNLDAGLIQDARFSRFFPQALLDERRVLLETDSSKIPNTGFFGRTYAADGHVTWDGMDARAARGRSTYLGVMYSIRTSLKKYASEGPAMSVRGRSWFRQTIALIDQMGTTPVLVLLPLHPTYLAAVRYHGWQKRHDLLLGWLAMIKQRYHDRFKVLGLSQLASVPGDPAQYYDGVHMKVANTRRVIDTVLRRLPHALDWTVPSPSPSPTPSPSAPYGS